MGAQACLHSWYLRLHPSYPVNQNLDKIRLDEQAVHYMYSNYDYLCTGVE